jgi:ribosomal protein L7Ae-like RNA K-turn-binding protein
MSTKTTIDPAQSPKVERGVRKFLDALNSNARVCLLAADVDPVLAFMQIFA